MLKPDAHEFMARFLRSEILLKSWKFCFKNYRIKIIVTQEMR